MRRKRNRKFVVIAILVMMINVIGIYVLASSNHKDQMKNFNYRYVSVLEFTSFHLDTISTAIRKQLVLNFEKDYLEQTKRIKNPSNRMPLILVGKASDDLKSGIEDLLAKQKTLTPPPPPPEGDEFEEDIDDDADESLDDDMGDDDMSDDDDNMDEMSDDSGDIDDEDADLIPGSSELSEGGAPPPVVDDKTKSTSTYIDLLDKYKFKKPELVITANLVKVDESGNTLKLTVYIEDIKFHKFSKINYYSGNCETLIQNTKEILKDVKSLALQILKRTRTNLKKERALLRKLDKNPMVLIKGGRFVMGQNKEKRYHSKKSINSKYDEITLGSDLRPGEYNPPKKKKGTRSPLELYLPSDSNLDILENAVITKEEDVKYDNDTRNDNSNLESQYRTFNDFDESPQHVVYIKDFYIDKYEVTNHQYQKFLLANPKWRKGFANPKLIDTNYLYDWKGISYPDGKASHPVRFVSWYAAHAYAKWLGQRLPTEAEWEYVAGGKNHYKWSHGNLFEAKLYSFDGQSTSKVSSQKSNSFGLFDMSGNIAEWCNSKYRPYPYVNDDREDYSISNHLRVIRGGAWNNFDSRALRCSNRLACEPTRCRATIGFRTAEWKKPKKKCCFE